MSKSEEIVIGILVVLGIITLVGVLLTVPLWLLWNWLCPTLFGLPKITLWQALGLNLLSSILFSKTSYSKK